MDLSGYTIQILIRVPYEDCSGFCAWMMTKSGQVLVGQHDADEEVTSTHCHLAVKDPCGLEGIRKQLIKHSLGAEKHSIMTKTKKGRVPYSWWKLCVYIIKGDMSNYRAHSGELDLAAIQADWKDYIPVQVALVGDKFVKTGTKVHDPNSKYSIVQECVAAIADKAIGNTELLNVVRQALIKREMCLGAYKVMDLCDSVLMYSKTHVNKWNTAMLQMLDKRYN